MEKSNNNKMNFFVRVYKAIFNFDMYAKFSYESISSAIKYSAILVLILSIVVTTIYVNSFKTKVLRGITYLDKNIDDINFTDGVFSYNYNEYAIYESEENVLPIIILDTSEQPNIEEYKDKVKLYDYGAILLRDKMIMFVSTQGTQNQFTDIRYSDYGITNMNKIEVLNLFNSPTIYICLSIAIFLIEYIQYFIYIMLNAVTLAIMGQLFAIILRLRLKFSETYKMGIYALTLPSILEMLYIIINVTTGFVIQYFSWMYTTISYIYICVAIFMIKADFINMQKELIRIKIEQQNNTIEQELEEEKEEPCDEEKKEKKENKDDTENKDDNLKEQTDG